MSTQSRRKSASPFAARPTFDAALAVAASLIETGKMTVLVHPDGYLVSEVSASDVEKACGTSISPADFRRVFGTEIEAAQGRPEQSSWGEQQWLLRLVALAHESGHLRWGRAPVGPEIVGRLAAPRGLPQALCDLASCADELETSQDPFDDLRLVMRMKKQYIGPAARAAQEGGLRDHSLVLVLLELGLPAIRGESMTEEQKEAIIFTARLVRSHNIDKASSRRAGRLMRRAGLDVLQQEPDEETHGLGSALGAGGGP